MKKNKQINSYIKSKYLKKNSLKIKHKTIGKKIDYDSIDDNSVVVLNHFRSADIEKIFQFD
mgnify:CR=1 FL=1